MPSAITKAEETHCCFQYLSVLAVEARCSVANGSVGCYGTIIAKQPEGRGLGDSGIQTTGLYLCGFLTAVLAH